ncbi:hypothetical protein D931_00503 [Enterococcus faecium 13.SD.W.09]|nr:hypothetical protein D931_00503 [Enterococcus faecium 13.SD.W.09]
MRRNQRFIDQYMEWIESSSVKYIFSGTYGIFHEFCFFIRFEGGIEKRWDLR